MDPWCGQAKGVFRKSVVATDTEEPSRIQSYQYLSAIRDFCPECGTPMIIRLADQGSSQTDIVALNVRAFLDIDPNQMKVLWVSMKDEEPKYDPDNIPTESVEQ